MEGRYTERQRINALLGLAIVAALVILLTIRTLA
jgi:hypothetical protein